MKSGTESKLKFKQLQRRLDLALWQARGLLDTLWNFVAHNCPPGDIGRFTDEEIGIGIDWRGDASELLQTLVSVRWLDEDAHCRLRVHDWPEHCEDAVHKALARSTDIFADGTIPKLSRFSEKERPQFIKAYEVKFGKEAVQNGRAFPNAPERSQASKNAPALPSLTIPSHTKPPPPTPSKSNAPPIDAAPSESDPEPKSGMPKPEEEEGTWASVERQLLALGVNEADKAIREARQNGSSPASILAIIAHYRSHPGAWESGGLFYRVRTKMPGVPPSEGWPPPSAQARQRQSAAARRADQEREQADQAREKAEANQAAEQLEREFGPRLESLSKAEAEALCNGNDVMLRTLKRHGRGSPLVKLFLLSELAQRGEA